MAVERGYIFEGELYSGISGMQPRQHSVTSGRMKLRLHAKIVLQIEPELGFSCCITGISQASTPQGKPPGTSRRKEWHTAPKSVYFGACLAGRCAVLTTNSN